MDANLVISLATLGIIAWYTIETMNLRKINSTLLKIEIQRKEPAIEVFFDNGNSFFSILMRIRNVGGSAAKNIRVQFDPPFDLGHKSINDYFNKNAIFKNGLSFLPSGSEYIVKAGFTPVASEQYMNNKIPRDYQITFEYENISGAKKKSTFNYNLDHFFHRMDPNDKTDTEKQLELINKNLEHLNKSIEEYVNRL